MKLGQVSLGELRRRFATSGERVTRAVLEELRNDPRAGARGLADALERRHAREARESRRLARLNDLERNLRRSGAERIAGVDEVGVGPLAGPVVAAAVVLPPSARLAGLDDSKRVRRPVRERLEREIRECALAIGIGWVAPDEIDRINVYQAGIVAMRRSLESLDRPPDAVFLDARRIPDLELEQHPIKGGDARVASVAAASIVAKVYRDAWMRDLGRRYPGYAFERNAGYGTSDHLRALALLGPCPAHRYSFAPVRDAAEQRRRAARNREAREGGATPERRRRSPTS